MTFTTLVGCAAAPILPAPSAGDEVTLFVPGYRGSFLEDAHGERAWLRPLQALQRGKQSLALPFPGERSPSSFGPLRPGGPLTAFVVIPGLLKVDIYLEWMKFGRARLPGFQAFSYDWRQDLRQSARELCAQMDRLVAERGGNVRINLVAHSMGGLVALQCLRHGQGEPGHPSGWAGARHVQRVVFVGTPFQGSPGIFKDFFVGTATLRNRALMSPEALLTFPSAFQLLPPHEDFLVDGAGGPVVLDAFRAATWWERNWGVFQDRTLVTDEAYRTQVARMLTAHRELTDALAPEMGPAPKFAALVVTGRGRPVIGRNRVTPEGFDFRQPELEDGDGTVMASRTLPPSPMEVTLMDSDSEHTALLRDPKVQEAIAAFLGTR